MKKLILAFMILCILIISSGCWNYREINQVAIVAGAAIDKNKDNNNYVLTIEIVNTKGDKEPRKVPDIVTTEGETIFDAVRNTIAKLGRRLYWSHAKVIIVNKDIAKEGVAPILDFIARNPELRTELWILVSEDRTAGNILKGKDKYHDTLSFHIDETLRNEKSISKYIPKELWNFLNDLSGEGISPVLPTTMLVAKEDEKVPETEGIAVFKKDKMVGTLNGEETMGMLFVIGKLKGGVMAIPDVAGRGKNATVEIIECKTKQTPIFVGNNLEMDINIEIDGDIAEIMGTEDLINKSGRLKLKRSMEELVKVRTQEVIKKVQKEYKSDIFGFGSIIQRKMPDYWKSIKPEWDEIFSNLDTNVNVKVNLKGSALNSTPIKVGD